MPFGVVLWVLVSVLGWVLFPFRWIGTYTLPSSPLVSIVLDIGVY